MESQDRSNPPSPSRSGDRSGNAWDRSGRSQGGGAGDHNIGRCLGDRWEVGEKIGMGGMATVHAGRDLRLERPVACKIMHPNIAENAEARERLAREARAIAQLKHENVIKVYDYASDSPAETWLITELIDGFSLREFLDRHPRPMPEVAVMIATEVLRALRSGHDLGVIHRDVKPDNILIDQNEGRPKLSDFGIAKLLNETKMTTTGNLVGSPSYMSPEQADGQHVDHRTDLFSMGIVLYRMVTGTLPFRGVSTLDTLRVVLEGKFIDPTEIAPESAGAVAGVIRRALSYRIEDRYQTADEMLADLQKILQDAGLTATWEELPRYFANPSAYEASLKARLSKELEARGRALLNSGEESRAIDCFNRVLSLGEGNQATLDVVRALSRRRNAQWMRRLAWAAGGAIAGVLAIVVLVMGTDLWSPPPPDAAHAAPLPFEATPLPMPHPEAPEATAASASLPTLPPSPKTSPQPSTTSPEDPTVLASAPETAFADEPPRKTTRRTRAKANRRGRGRPRPGSKAKASARDRAIESPATDPPTPTASETETGFLQVGSKVWVDVYVDGKRVGRAPNQSRYLLPVGAHTLTAEQPNSNCQRFKARFTIRPGETTRLRLNVVCP